MSAGLEERSYPDDAGPEARSVIARLRAEVEHLRAVLGQAGDVIVTADLDGRVINWNDGAERFYGYTRDEAIGMSVGQLYRHAASRRAMTRKLHEAEGNDAVVRRDVQVLTKHGKAPWVNLSLSWLRDADGKPAGTIGVSKDVTRRRQLEQKLRRTSITDKLTGLYNQSHFFHRLEIEKERAIRLKHPLALLLFDLDGFKGLNDTQGHVAGDAVLKQVGGVLFQNVRKEVDSGFRYGGDEFTVLLPGASAQQAVSFAERVRARIAALGHGVRSSHGVVTFDLGNRAQRIVQQADAAMYTAKRAGGDRIAVFDVESETASVVEAPRA